jgi:hypothetical protein
MNEFFKKSWKHSFKEVNLQNIKLQMKRLADSYGNFKPTTTQYK